MWVRSFFRRSHSSLAALFHFGNSNSNPDLSNRVGMTRRLFRTSSVSVFMKNAPTASCHSNAGSPKGMPYASRKIRMNSLFGKGFGDAMLTGPETSSCSISHFTALTKSRSCTHEIYCLPLPAVPPSHRSDTGDFSPLLKITFIRICHT